MTEIDFINFTRPVGYFHVPFTMTSIERISELYRSLEKVRLEELEGDIVECGVWRGGNILGIMNYLDYYKMYQKRIWLYDTFNGMTDPTEKDIDLFDNKASDILHLENIICLSTLDEVKENLSNSDFPQQNLNWIVGDVCNTLTISNNIPEKISILRLDTDWYESTKFELEVLYPKVVKGGIVIIDDYGHWKGSKQATDEYFENNPDIETSVIDYTGLKIVKKHF